MATDLHRRVSDVFDAAVELDPGARAVYLDFACRDEPGVRREVESLFASYEGTPTTGLFPPLLRAEPAATLAVGERVGPYVLRRELGAGGMGVVYEAAREDVGKTVALKLVRHGRLASPDHLRRFLLERRVLARLDHPNVARLLDAGVTAADLPYLVLEYVDGEPIDRWCDARRLDVAERLALFQQVCDAVHYAHRHLVVHRDLKPSNILVTGEGVVKLLDFGIAALLEEGRDAEGRLTRTGLVMLTPEYAAPEQVRGEPVTTASDVYALGLLLFELLTGCRPFRREGRSAHELLREVRDEAPARPSDVVRRPRARDAAEAPAPERLADARRATPQRLARRLAGDLDTIVLRALSSEPERRYHSVQELRDDLARHLSGLPVRARGDSLWYRARKFARRHAAAAAAAALVVVSLAGGAVAAAVQARRAEAARAVAEQRFRDVRALAGALLFDVHDAIADLPGSLPVRATLVARAVEHLDRLHRQAGDDPDLAREIAAAYVRLGLVQGNPTGANLGDLAAARRSFERALAIAEPLVARDARDSAALRTLALAHEKMSDADAWSGHLPAAVAHSRRALAAWQSLASGSPSRGAPRRAVAISHVKLGDILGNPILPSLGDTAGAGAEYRSALALLESAPRDSGDDWARRRWLAIVHERLGTLLRQEGRYAEGIAELERMLVIREALLRERSTSTSARRDVAVAHQLLCESRLAAGDDDAALAHCRRAAAQYEALRSADPSNAQSLHDIVLGQLSMHKVLLARGEPAAALAQLDRGTAVLRRLLATDSANASLRRTLARTLLHAAIVHARLGALADTPRAARHAHARRAAASHDEGRRLLLASAAPGPSAEDAALLARAGAMLAGVVRPER